MTGPLTPAFAALTLTVGGRRLGPDEKTAALASTVAAAATLGTRTCVVLVADPEPLRYALKVLALLDAGHVPVLLASDAPVLQLERAAARFPGAARWTGPDLAPGGRPSRAGEGAEAVESPPSGSYGCLTSGTTSTPKVRFFSVSGALENARAHGRSLSLDEHVTVLQSLPIHHAFGTVAYVFAPLAIGCAVDFNAAFLPLRTLRKRCLTRAVLHASPAQVRFWLREDEDLPDGLEAVSVGGGPLDPAEAAVLQARARTNGARLFATYGLTEAGPRVTTGPLDVVRAGAIGRAIDGVQIAVLDDGGTMRAEGNGTLCVASPSLATNLEAASIAPDGRSLLTRDIVEILPSGDVLLRGRGDDLLKIGGLSVYPADVEAAARACSGVVDCAVVKHADAMYGDGFDLVVEVPGDAGAGAGSRRADIERELTRALSLPQLPRRTVVVERLPRTALGKVDRLALSKLLQGGAAP